MRVAPGPADPVAIDAELLPCPAVTTRAGHRIEPRLCSVCATAARGGEPTRGVRAPARRRGGDVARRVAIDARAFAVARDAKAGIRASLERMSRAESGAMQPRQHDLVERETRWKSRHDAHAVTAGALPLAVASGAKIARARGAYAVFAHEIAVVHQVTRRKGALRGEIDVTTVAIARSPLIFVLMTSETRRHLRTQRFRPFDADLDVTAHAVALRRRHVRAVLEPKMPARELGAAADVALAVTIFAAAFVVRLFVTATAIVRVGKVQRALIAGRSDALVTRKTPDPFENVCPMLERVRRLASNAEHAGASARHDRDHEEP